MPSRCIVSPDKRADGGASIRAVSRAVLPQGLSYNVGHFGPTLARSKGPCLGPDFAVQRGIRGRADGVRGRSEQKEDGLAKLVPCRRESAEAAVSGAISA